MEHLWVAQRGTLIVGDEITDSKILSQSSPTTNSTTSIQRIDAKLWQTRTDTALTLPHLIGDSRMYMQMRFKSICASSAEIHHWKEGLSICTKGRARNKERSPNIPLVFIHGSTSRRRGWWKSSRSASTNASCITIFVTITMIATSGNVSAVCNKGRGTSRRTGWWVRIAGFGCCCLLKCHTPILCFRHSTCFGLRWNCKDTIQ